MIPKPITLLPPWKDQSVIHLERMLVSLFSGALQMRSGTYMGDGTSSKTLTVGIKVLFIFIMRKATGSYNGVFAFREAEGYSYIPGSGIVSDAVKSFGVNDITIGANTSINAAGAIYAYFAIG